MDTEVFKNAKPASVLLGAALVGVAAHAAYAILDVQAAGFDTLFSSWAFYGLALLVLGAAVARPGLVHDERRAWTAAAVAFAAWFMGSIFYATGGNAEKDLYAFPLADALLATVRRRGRRSPSRCSSARASSRSSPPCCSTA